MKNTTHQLLLSWRCSSVLVENVLTKKKSDKPVKLKGFLFLELDEIEVSALSGFDEFGEEVSERS